MYKRHLVTHRRKLNLKLLTLVMALAMEMQGAYSAKDFSRMVSRARNRSKVRSAVVGRMKAVRLKTTAM
jgi:hypothetical protein